MCNSISIHALLAESDLFHQVVQRRGVISIHALLAESDRCPTQCPAGPAYFYPRSPCGERRQTAWPGCLPGYFYPRSPCGERPTNDNCGSDGVVFLSTLSLRRATQLLNFLLRVALISIHALLAESNWDEQTIKRLIVISIHALLAESDRNQMQQGFNAMQFLSTLSLRRATIVDVIGQEIVFVFLSTLSLRRATALFPGGTTPLVYFYPRSPCGERLIRSPIGVLARKISIHALLAESDYPCGSVKVIRNGISIHALLAESDLFCASW